MRQRVKSTILVLSMVVWAVNAMADTGIGYSQIAEDMDIMSALIDRALEGKFPDEYSAASLFRGFRGCQGIYLKGYGAVFVTSINFPVAERPEPQTEVSQDDAWQRMKQELKGAPTEAYGYLGSGGNYNPEKVEELKKQFLELIGTYGSNIRQLGSQESVIIAVRGMLGPGLRFELDVKRFKMGTEEIKKREEEIKKMIQKTMEDELLKREIELQKEGEELQQKGAELQKREEELHKAAEQLPKLPKEPQDRMEGSNKEIVPPAPSVPSSGVEPIVPSTGFQMPTNIIMPPSIIGNTRAYTTMIVKASREDIAAFKNGKLNFDGFTKRAEIIQY